MLEIKTNQDFDLTKTIKSLKFNLQKEILIIIMAVVLFAFIVTKLALILGGPLFLVAGIPAVVGITGGNYGVKRIKKLYNKNLAKKELLNNFAKESNLKISSKAFERAIIEIKKLNRHVSIKTIYVLDFYDKLQAIEEKKEINPPLRKPNYIRIYEEADLARIDEEKKKSLIKQLS